MAQRQPRFVPEPAPQYYVPDLAPRLELTRPSGAMESHVHEALDLYEDDLTYVEEVVRGAGLSASRLFLETDQMTTSTLDISYRRREAIGFADAEEKARWQQGRRRYLDRMSAINDAGARAVQERLFEALDAVPEPPPARSKLVAFLRDG